jgi:Tfp pilus assembly protein PilX
MRYHRQKHNVTQGVSRLYKTRQRGFVLVLALVMLAVLTLIGVSSMNSANMELKATANAQQHQVAFNAVQSALEFAVSDTGPTPLYDFQTSDPTAQVIWPAVANASALSASAVYAGCSTGVGSSVQKNKGFSYNFFNITGTGSNTTGTATSIQNQGIRYPAAACDK